MKSILAACTVFALLVAAPSAAQLGSVLGGLQKAKQAKDTIDSVTFTDDEEQQLGARSAKCCGTSTASCRTRRCTST